MNLQKWLNNVGLDKKHHMILGVGYSALIPLGALFGFYGALFGFLLGTYLVLWKELWNDWYKKRGNAEFLDFVWNEIPLVITFITYLL